MKYAVLILLACLTGCADAPREQFNAQPFFTIVGDGVQLFHGGGEGASMSQDETDISH